MEFLLKCEKKNKKKNKKKQQRKNQFEKGRFIKKRTLMADINDQRRFRSTRKYIYIYV